MGTFCPANNAMQGPYGYKFYLVQIIYANCSFFKMIKKVSLLACLNFWLRLKTESQIKPVQLAHAGPLQRQRPNRCGSRTSSPRRACMDPA